MTIDSSISLASLLQILEIISIVGGGGLVSFKLGRSTSRVEEILKTQSIEITELKNETKKLGDILTTIAVQGARLERLEADIRELKRAPTAP